ACDAAKILIAAGVWSRKVGDLIGFSVPVIPARGQILVSEPVARRLLRHTIGGIGIRQLRHNGALLIGALQEPGEQANVSTLEGIRSIAETALRLAPALAGLRIVRAFSGVRPIPYDGYPLLGEVPGRPGVYTAVSHSGIGLAPILGLLSAELMTGRAPSYDVAPYRVDRILHHDQPLPATVKFR
ncbi:MAG TPA: FAD-dependent oxidoreductase, partial [Bacillota bacterium]